MRERHRKREKEWHWEKEGVTKGEIEIHKKKDGSKRERGGVEEERQDVRQRKR